MGGLEGRLNALIEASAQGQRAESTSGRSGSLPPFRLSSEAELSAAGKAWHGRRARFHLKSRPLGALFGPVLPKPGQAKRTGLG
jgi:hypothetical protein